MGVIGMLRITTAETATEQSWTLEGRLARPWVVELKTSWQKDTPNQERTSMHCRSQRGDVYRQRRGNAAAKHVKAGRALTNTEGMPRRIPAHIRSFITQKGRKSCHS